MSSLDIENACSTSRNESIGTTSLEAASCNLSSLDRAVNSSESTWTSRTGIVRDTIQGALNKLGVLYDDPIRDWAPSLVVSDLRAHRYPATTGDIYIPVAPLPFTTGSSFNSDNWVLLSGITSQDLINDLSQAYEFATVAAMKASTVALPVGKTINTVNNNSGNQKGGARYVKKSAGQAALDGDVIDGYGNHFLADGSVAILKDARTNLNYGCISDGVADDTSAISALDAAGGGLITDGIVRITSNTSLTSNYEFKNGGVIAVDNTFTVTWSGAITAENVKCLQGDFQLTKVHRVSEVKVAWFGGISGDLLTNVQNTPSNLLIANANAKAIREAANMCVIGGTDGIYITPILRLVDGLCIVDDDDDDGVILDIMSYMTVKGFGDSSVIRPIDGAKAFDVMSMTQNAANSMILDDFQIYGEASQQTNVQSGIVANPSTQAQIYNVIGNNVYVKEMSGNAGRMTGRGWENSKWNPRLMRDSTLHNLLVTACNEVEFTGCTYRTAKSGQSGAVFDGLGVISAHIHSNNFDENNANGLVMSNTGGRHRVHDNGMKSNFTGQGASFDRVDHSQINDNKFEANGTRGATLSDSTDVDYSHNKSRSNQEHGQVFSCDNSNIIENTSQGDGQGTDDTYSGILITGASADDNNIQGNRVRHGGGAIQLKYGIHVEPGTASTNLVTNNDLKNAGRTANLFDDGGGTVTAPGNRVS